MIDIISTTIAAVVLGLYGFLLVRHLCDSPSLSSHYPAEYICAGNRGGVPLLEAEST
jgi:hypothetical protein